MYIDLWSQQKVMLIGEESEEFCVKSAKKSAAKLASYLPAYTQSDKTC